MVRRSVSAHSLASWSARGIRMEAWCVARVGLKKASARKSSSKTGVLLVRRCLQFVFQSMRGVRVGFIAFWSDPTLEWSVCRAKQGILTGYAWEEEGGPEIAF